MSQMQQYGARLTETFGEFLPTLLAAIAVLVIGWLVALLISKVVKAALRRTTLDDRLARSLQSDPEGPPPNIEEIVGKVVFWVLMVAVLIGFFQILGLAFVADPLNNFVGEIFDYLPNLLSAALLLLIAWLVARVLRFLVQKGARALDLDSRLEKHSKAPEDEDEARSTPDIASDTTPDTRATTREASSRPGLATTLGETVYWLTFLLFLPAVLDALQLTGLLRPVDELVGEILGFLPNILAACLILALGWLVARIVQRVVANLLAAAGFDALGERIGLSTAAGGRTASQIVGLVLYVLILIPVAIAALNALSIDAITDPASAMLDQILQAIPHLLAAAVIITAAWLIGRVVAGLVANLLASFGFDRFLANIGLVRSPEASPTRTEGEGAETPAVGSPEHVPSRRPSEVVGYLVLIGIVLFAVIEALAMLEMELLAGMVTEFTLFAGNVLLGVLIFVIGYYLAGVAARVIRSSEVSNEDLLARVAQGAIIVLAAVMALRQAGLAEDVILLAFGLTLGAAAIAAAIAFGFGGRDAAHRYVERWTNRAESRGAGSSRAPDTGGDRGGSAPPPTV